jgi:hypothetical protein
MDPNVKARTHRLRSVPRLLPLVMATFACMELEQPLGDAPLTGEGGETDGGGTAGKQGGTVGGTGGDTGATGGAGGTQGGTKAGIGGAAASTAGGAPPMPGNSGTGGGAAGGGSTSEPSDGGEQGNPDVRFVMVGPLDPAGDTLRGDVYYATDWVGADATGSVLAGFSQSPDTESDFTTGVRVLWTSETGTVRLPYSSPSVGMYSLSRLSRDGRNVFGEVAKVEQRVNSTRFGPVAFYRWTEESGDVPFGPPDAMWNGQVDFVSADGTAALGIVELESEVDTGGGTHNYRWSEGRGFEFLTTLGWPMGAVYTAVSEDLTAIAGSADGQGFLWFDPDRVVPLTGIDTFPYCSASELSSDGMVAFGSCSDESFQDVTGFRWTEETGMVAIDLPGDILTTRDGSVAFGTDGQALYRWTAASDSERLELPQGWATSPYAIELWGGNLSEDGSTLFGLVGTRAADDPDRLERRLFRWTEAAGFVRLDPLPGHDVSDIQGQASDGSVQVGLSGTGQQRDAVLWDCVGVRDITRELSEGGADLSGAVLNSASKVWVGSTLMVAGSGQAMGNRVAWIAWLPNRC